MVKITPEYLRWLADTIEQKEKYGCMCGCVYLTMHKYPSGKEYAEFEQPCGYAECTSSYYRLG